MRSFEYHIDGFYKDGKKHSIYAGAVHYFRCVPEYWEDRLLKLKNAGLNTVETYLAWNMIERKEGQFDFTGINDFGKFIDIANRLGLDCILRIGPFICAEWDMGALPSWLLNYPGIELRCNNDIYLEKVENYIRKISEIIVPRLYVNGGNVTMLQVENEYGSYGNDFIYREKIINMYRKYGLNALYFTSDGPEPIMMDFGMTKGCLTTCNFGGEVKERNDFFQDYHLDMPFMCMEFWIGWFDVWHSKHRHADTEEFRQNIHDFLDVDASFNLYMFCGGTNHSLLNGANYENGKYFFQATSYDRECPLTEAGDLTPKYFALKEEIEKKTGKKIELDVKNSIKFAYPTLKPSGYKSLMSAKFNVLNFVKSSGKPRSFEELGQDYGFCLYHTKAHLACDCSLSFEGLHDRAVVMVNNNTVGVYETDYQEDKIPLKKSDDFVDIDILVENLGRVDYGFKLGEGKGIFGGVLIEDRQQLLDYDNYTLNLDSIKDIAFDKEIGKSKCPAFYEFNLDVEAPLDTFIEPKGFTHGFISVNGHILGRFFVGENEPQVTLYLPGPLLKKGENKIVVFETDEANNPSLVFHKEAIFND